MSQNKKLKIKSESKPDAPKKLVLKKGPAQKSLKIKNNSLPNLNETPEPKEQKPQTKAPRGLTIKAATPEPQPQQTKAPRGLTIKAATPEPQQQTKAPRGLTIKAATPEPQPQQTEAPRGLTIKAATPEPQQQTKAPRGLTIKAATPEPQPQQTKAPRGLTIKAATPEPQQGQNNGLTIKNSAPQQLNPLQTPPPMPAPNFQAPATSTKPPPPMPTGYSSPPPPQPSINPQGPMFPTQGQAGERQAVGSMLQGEPAINPQGPVFPTAGQTAEGKPPGTMPPPTHKKGTSAPLSAIMGEVRPARRINPAELQQQPINQKPEVLKVKKPTGFLKDLLGNEFCLIPKGKYYIGIENEQEDVKVEFTLGRYPVTKEQYFEFIKESDIQYSPEELNQINKISPYPNCPAVMVSWTDAKNYCRWLRDKTGEYYALPSIKEWEAAARSPDGRIYPWGEDEPNTEIACFNDGHMEPQSTCSVDYFTDNLSPYGCVGMIGNVMEWTLDSFEDERNPHILKGGSWMSSIDFCNNVTPCMSFPENKRKEFFGFRLLYLPKELYEKYRNNQNS